MIRSRILWTAVAVMLIVAGFVLDRTVLDDEPDQRAASAEDDGSDDDGVVEPDADASNPPETADQTVGGSSDVEVSDPTSDTVEERGPPRYSDLPTITLNELPSEAIDVLQAIEDGGPYVYDQDDSVFQNREGILPDRDHGHYREYTVETPGLGHRGERRIVAGADGERYWTDDHYESFSEILF